MFPFGVFSSRGFKVKLNSYSVALLPGNEREDVDRGGKIIMPPSSLDWLSRLNVSYPMLFRITNQKVKRTSHCGVLEFIAEEGMVYLPNWMMRNLMLEEGDIAELENTTLPVATFSKFQPLSEDFLDIHNPKAVLENLLRQFACLTTGDVINIRYNDRNYELSVLETKPGSAVSIIECDMNVDFAAPLGYKEPPETGASEMEVDDGPEYRGVMSFPGEGHRLDGKPRKQSDSEVLRERLASKKTGVPDYEWRVGTLNFMRHHKKVQFKGTGEVKGSDFEAFAGKGYTLKKDNGS